MLTGRETIRLLDALLMYVLSYGEMACFMPVNLNYSTQHDIN